MARAPKKARCPRCGKDVSRGHLAKHQGSKPCQANATTRDMQARGLEPLPGKASSHEATRLACARAGVETVVAPGAYGGFKPGSFQAGIYQRGTSAHLQNVLYVPRWVWLLREVARAGLVVESLREVKSWGPEYHKAMDVNYRLGGTKALADFLKVAGVL